MLWRNSQQNSLLCLRRLEGADITVLLKEANVFLISVRGHMAARVCISQLHNIRPVLHAVFAVFREGSGLLSPSLLCAFDDPVGL